MDRVTVYRDQLPYETDVLQSERWAYEGIGLLALDLMGDATVVSGLDAQPTTPAGFQIRVGPGRIYQKEVLDAAAWGRIAETGGLGADTNPDHAILKQGVMRDTATIALDPPEAAGHSIVYLIEATFLEADAPATNTQFYNVQNPLQPTNLPMSRSRIDRCVLKVTPGVAAPTGAETAPAVSAGYVPVWIVTVAAEDVAITAAMIEQHPEAPLVSTVGGGGGGAGLKPWTVVNAPYTALPGDRLIANTAGGSFVVTLPANPNPATEVTIKGNFVANNLTVARNGKTIVGLAEDLILNKDFITVSLVYDGTTWRV